MDINEFDSVSEEPFSAEYASSSDIASRPFNNDFASSPNSFAGSSKPRNEQSQQRRRPRKDNNRFDAT